MIEIKLDTLKKATEAYLKKYCMNYEVSMNDLVEAILETYYKVIVEEFGGPGEVTHYQIEQVLKNNPIMSYAEVVNFVDDLDEKLHEKVSQNE